MPTVSPTRSPVPADYSYSFPAGKGAGIMVIENAISPEDAEMLYLFAMDASNDGLGNPGKTLGGVLVESKNSIDIPLTQRAEWTGIWSMEALRGIGYDLDALDDAVCRAITCAIQSFQSEYLALGGITSWSDTGYQIQRYRANQGYYRVHVDSDPENQPNRIFAAVLYLNTVAEGGETQFPLHNVVVKPVAGRMAVFPAGWMHPHEGRTPVSEDKVVVTTFLYSSKYWPA